MTTELRRLSEKQLRALLSIRGANKLKEEYDRQGGKGFAEDVWKGILSTGKTVNDFLKSTKIISKAGKLAKYVLPAIAGVAGPEVLAGIPIAEKIGSTAESLGYGCECMDGGRYSDMRGKGWNTGLTTLGMGSSGENVLTVSRNGTFQLTEPTHINKSGRGILADNTIVDAGAPQLSGIMSGLGSSQKYPSDKSALGQYGQIYGMGKRGCSGLGVGAFGVVASDSSIKV